MVDLLACGAPFVNLPIGATEDRLLGGLDLEEGTARRSGVEARSAGRGPRRRALRRRGQPSARHLADALLDAAASGLHVVEREGFSATQAADFV